MARLSSEVRWWRTINWLEENYPAQYPVMIRRVPPGALLKNDADCGFEKRKFLIRINRNKSYATRHDYLLHEWAHALTWFIGAPCDAEPHSAEWGVAHARLYRNYLKWNYGRKKRKTKDEK